MDALLPPSDAFFGTPVAWKLQPPVKERYSQEHKDALELQRRLRGSKKELLKQRWVGTLCSCLLSIKYSILLLPLFLSEDWLEEEEKSRLEYEERLAAAKRMQELADEVRVVGASWPYPTVTSNH